jgi:MYXO-CTERM domain-containing protein
MTHSKFFLSASLFIVIASDAALAASATQLTSASQLNSSDTAFIDHELDQVGVNYGATAFANNTKIIGAGGFQGPGDGKAITIKFATAVDEFGLNVEEYNGGAYTVSFTAYDASGNSLGTFTASGNDPSTLSFEGLKSSTPISKVVFDDSAAGGSNDLIFGNIVFQPFVTTSSAPEPSGLMLVAGGLAALAGIRRYRRPSTPR